MDKRKLITAGFVVALFIFSGFFLTDYARRVEPAEDDRTAWLKGKIIAHRGLHDNNVNIPENSISAFAAATEKGYIIELDVSLTKDKKLVVFHDKKLKRLFELDRYLKDISYGELSRLRLPNSNETVPLFGEVLNFVGGKVPLLIEIKNEGKVGEMESMVYDQLKNYKGKYAIQSFNPYTLKWFRMNAPEVLRGQLSGSFIISDYEVEYAGTTRLPGHKRFLLKNMLFNFESRPNFIAYEVNNTSDKRIKSLKKLGVPVLGWTIKEQTMYEKVKNEYDNLIVDIAAIGHQ